jgi:hypothetical protein
MTSPFSQARPMFLFPLLCSLFRTVPVFSFKCKIMLSDLIYLDGIVEAIGAKIHVNKKLMKVESILSPADDFIPDRLLLKLELIKVVYTISSVNDVIPEGLLLQPELLQLHPPPLLLLLTQIIPYNLILTFSMD